MEHVDRAELERAYKDYSEYTQEKSYRTRVRREAAIEAVKHLRRISQQHIDEVRTIAPAIEEIVRYTPEQLIANEHNEVEQIQDVYNRLASFFCDRMKRYKEQL